MKLLATITLLAFASAALAAGEKPPPEVFQQSRFEFTFKTPPAFKLTTSKTGYFPTPMGNVPYEEKAWQNKADTISTKVTVPTNCIAFVHSFAFAARLASILH